MRFSRLDEIKGQLGQNDAVLILGEPNRFYLTNFLCSDGFVFLTQSNSYFFTDSRYIEKARQTVLSMESKFMKNIFEDIKKLIIDCKIEKVYIDISYIPLDIYLSLVNRTEETAEISKSDKFDKILKDLRSVKSEDELKNIKAAQKLTDETFSYITNRITEGRSEKEIMLDMEFFIRKNGSEGVSFDFITVSGKNSSLPHGVPTDKKICRGDFVTMDFGAVINGYRSDMTRTVAVGFADEEMKKIYSTVLKANTEAEKNIKAGLKCCDIDRIARGIIKNAGYGDCFGHALGHSVGIEIHESPAFSPKCDKVLQPNTVITVEPGIYIEGKYGVRIEDMVCVTKDGCEILTKSQKELIIL